MIPLPSVRAVVEHRRTADSRMLDVVEQLAKRRELLAGREPLLLE